MNETDETCLLKRSGNPMIRENNKNEASLLKALGTLSLKDDNVKLSLSATEKQAQPSVREQQKTVSDSLTSFHKSGHVPGDFFQKQRMHTSALARKTKTTSHFGGCNLELFSELQNLHKHTTKTASKEISKEEKKDDTEEKNHADADKVKEATNEDEVNKSDKDEVEEENTELIGRTPGPVQPIRSARPVAEHPYHDQYRGRPILSLRQQHPQQNGMLTPQDFFNQQSHGKRPDMLGKQRKISAETYLVKTSPQHNVCQQQAGKIHNGYHQVAEWSAEPQNQKNGHYPEGPEMGDIFLKFIDQIGKEALAPGGTKNGCHEKPNRLTSPSEEQLPDELSDFILQYSQHYADSSRDRSLGVISRESSSSESSLNSDSPQTKSGIAAAASEETADPLSPMGANSVPSMSPAVPYENLLSPPNYHQHVNENDNRPDSAKHSSALNHARTQVRNLFSDADHNAAWIWALKCVQACPGALAYRDTDGDSLMHIVTWHKDLPKIYALTELMLKVEHIPNQKLFDLPNRLHETPLNLAVQKRLREVVCYLLECGANPNSQTMKPDANAALHCAAARGMADIVRELCAFPATDKNLRNYFGLTPLLCAVTNHGAVDEDSEQVLDNIPAIRALLMAGADPTIPGSGSRKSVIHFAVELMDPDLIMVFRDNLPRHVMTQLVNMESAEGYTALDAFGLWTGANQRAPVAAEQKQTVLGLLRLCGAVSRSSCAGQPR